MRLIQTSAYELAERFIGFKEVKGNIDNPAIMAMLRLDNTWPDHDEVPWCSAFVNYIAWLLRLPRSKDLRARSWLRIGIPVRKSEAVVGFDICVFRRGTKDGADVLDAPGHVAFFAGFTDRPVIQVLGGNQGDQVGISEYPLDDLLSIRRLLPDHI